MSEDTASACKRDSCNQDDNSSDSELMLLTQNVEHLKSFLEQVKIRDKEEISLGCNKIILDLKDYLKDYVSDKNKKEGIRKDDLKEDTKPKMETTEKTRAVKKKTETYREYSSSDCEYEEGSSSSEIESRASRSRKKARRSRKRTSDDRVLPEIYVYNECTGQDLKSYLDEFENYCVEKYKGSDRLWAYELEKKLTGRVLERLQLVRRHDDSYRDVKRKLLRWSEGEKEVRISKRKKAYENAKQKPEEDNLTFSDRLENLYCMAYPNKEIEYNEKLIEKFMKCVCRPLRHKIDNMIFEYDMHDRKLKWSRVKKCARIFDLKQTEGSDKEEEKHNEIIINVNNSTSDGNKPNFPSQIPKRETRRYDEKNYNRRVQFTAPNVPRYYGQKCNYCKKYGHLMEQCRYRLKACFVCGDQSHFAKDCPRNRWRTNYKRNNSTSPQKANNYNDTRSNSCMPNKQSTKSLVHEAPKLQQTQELN